MSLTAADLLDIHAEVVRAVGGGTGLRNIGLLDSIVKRANSATTAIEQAAALLREVVLLRPFVQANGATAYVAADVLLGLKGYRLEAEAREVEELVGLLRGPTVDGEAIEAWVREHAQPRVREA
jgi:prophage maintenance system killer protein